MSGECDCSPGLSQAQWHCGACLTAQAGVWPLGCCSPANNEPFWGCQNCQNLNIVVSYKRYPANFILFYSIPISSLIMNLFEGVESGKILLLWWLQKVSRQFHNIYSLTILSPIMNLFEGVKTEMYPANFILFHSIAISRLIMNLFEGVESGKILLSWWVMKSILPISHYFIASLSQVNVMHRLKDKPNKLKISVKPKLRQKNSLLHVPSLHKFIFLASECWPKNNNKNVLKKFMPAKVKPIQRSSNYIKY